MRLLIDRIFDAAKEDSADDNQTIAA